MKVLIIHCSYKNKGGEDTVVAEEMGLLKANNVEVELLLFDNSKRTLLNVMQMPFNIFSYLKTRKKLRTFRPDLVHIHNIHFSASPSVVYAVKKERKPMVVTLHNYRLVCPSALLFHKGRLFLSSLTQSFPSDAIRKGAYKNSKVLTLWLALSMKLHHWLGTWQSASRYIVLSKHARQIFLSSALQLRPEQVTIKPNFTAVSSPGSQKHANYFLYVGRLSEEKGINVMLDAFAGTNIPLKIAGDGPLREKVMEYINRFSNIEYMGPLASQDVRKLLTNCSALIFPSIWYEGMPLVIIEGFACGAPVIASKLGVMENMVEPGFNGLHFEPGNKNDLREKIRQWEGMDCHEKEIYRQNAFRTYEHLYTPEKNIEQLLSIYNDVVGSS